MPTEPMEPKKRKVRIGWILTITLPLILLIVVIYLTQFPFSNSSSLNLSNTSTSIASLVQQENFFANPETIAACEAGGGKWKKFNNCTGDLCTKPGICDTSLQSEEGCDCGALQCWDGTTCIDNP